LAGKLKVAEKPKMGAVVKWFSCSVGYAHDFAPTVVWNLYLFLTKLAVFVLTSLILRFQTTLLCLKPCGRGHSPRYFFSVFFCGRA